MASDTLHVDDTPVPVLAPGTGKTKTGRLWIYVRDERPFAGARPPVALFFYSADRKGEHPRTASERVPRGHPLPTAMPGSTNCSPATGLPRPPAGRTSDANSSTSVLPPARRSPRKPSNASAISTRSRRQFRVRRPMFGTANASSVPSRSPRHWPPEQRRPCAGCPANPNSPRPSATRSRWKALLRCINDGRLALDNNRAERPRRCVAIGRKNYLFAGSDAGGLRAAVIYSLLETAKLNGRNPQHYLADILARIADHPARQIVDLLPWNWAPSRSPARRRLTRRPRRAVTTERHHRDPPRGASVGFCRAGHRYNRNVCVFWGGV